MKAKITKEQLAHLMWDYLPFNAEHSKFLIKTDMYFSFNGETPKKPKHIVRLRNEVAYNFKDVLKERGVEWDPLSYKENADLELVAEKSIEMLQTDWDDLMTTDKHYCLLTVKEKRTIEDSEMNTEYEGEMSKEAGMAFYEAMKVANFKPYFLKNKNSISFYIEKDLHCEIVSVNGSDVYLEVECCTDEPTIPTPTERIRKFMNDLGITEFDTRSWADIIDETLQKNK